VRWNRLSQMNGRSFSWKSAISEDMYGRKRTCRNWCSVEKQLAELSCVRMAGAAAHPALKGMLIHHRGENRDLIRSDLHDHPARSMAPIPAAHTDQGHAGARHRDQEMLTMLYGRRSARCRSYRGPPPEARHYEIAAYVQPQQRSPGQLDFAATSRRCCHLSLEEEKRADALLTQHSPRTGKSIGTRWRS